MPDLCYSDSRSQRGPEKKPAIAIGCGPRHGKAGGCALNGPVIGFSWAFVRTRPLRGVIAAHLKRFFALLLRTRVSKKLFRALEGSLKHYMTDGSALAGLLAGDLCSFVRIRPIRGVLAERGITHTRSGFFCAATKAPGPKEAHRGSWRWPGL